MIKLGVDIAIGRINRSKKAIIPEIINFTLFLVKKKNAKPTIPYSLTRVPNAIKNAD